MRLLAMFTTAMLGVAVALPTLAQPNQAGPQPGLPPGAGVGAPNALQPRGTGEVNTTTVAPPARYAAPAATASAPTYTRPHRTVRRHRNFPRRNHRLHPPAPAPVNANQ